MIAKRWTRNEIIEKLRNKIKQKKPLLFSSAGNGLVAKLLEKAGADCISTFSGARLRNNGWGTMSMLWPMMDANEQVLNYTEHDILTALKGEAFICAFINANDLLRDIRGVLEKLISIGVLSICHSSPSISDYDKDSHIYKLLNKSGITFENEIDMLALAKEMGMVTVAMPFTVEDSIAVVEKALPDIFCFQAGTTKGGLVGFDTDTPYTLEDTARRTEEAFKAVLKIKKDLILLAHGASLVTPEDGQYILNKTSAHGLWTGSATERIPIEKAVLSVAKEFANLIIK